MSTAQVYQNGYRNGWRDAMHGKPCDATAPRDDGKTARGPDYVRGYRDGWGDYTGEAPR
jgi:hypothetical protein